MATLRFILGDQLTRGISALRGLDPATDVVLMAEVMGEATYVRHHKQKIAFLFSAMRHFADSLREEGIRVDYVTIDDPANTQSFTGELERAIRRHGPSEIVVTEPGEWRVWEMMLDWRESLPVPVHIREDDRFICSRDEFARWAEGRKQYRMEFFYREMRRKTGLLMAGEEPEGGQWNFDHDNRKALPADVHRPARRRFAPDAITREVLDLVARRFGAHFGDLEPFGWAVTRADALIALDHFIADCLDGFGDYQDAMKTGEDFLFHAVISPYLNCGLLTAREVCDRAEAAWRLEKAPLNAVEGFIRQVIGWREFVRLVYRTRGRQQRIRNYWGYTKPLPAAFYTATTGIAPVDHVIRSVLDTAYCHHIERLMILGNFLLLCDLHPDGVYRWFMELFIDAYDWVMVPNVYGMSQFADGGGMTTKPYLSGSSYVLKMSDHKKGDWCPVWDALYWRFIDRHADFFRSNPRMAVMVSMKDKLGKKLADHHRTAERFLSGLI
jgi:deoxyribodipyrimidine photolyase-related protein